FAHLFEPQALTCRLALVVLPGHEKPACALRAVDAKGRLGLLLRRKRIEELSGRIGHFRTCGGLFLGQKSHAGQHGTQRSHQSQAKRLHGASPQATVDRGQSETVVWKTANPGSEAGRCGDAIRPRRLEDSPAGLKDYRTYKNSFALNSARQKSAN